MYNEWEEFFVYTFELDIGGSVGHLLPANDAVCEHAYLWGYSWWGVGKVEPGPELFFFDSGPDSTFHEFKIIPTPTQLSAYANHELKS